MSLITVNRLYKVVLGKLNVSDTEIKHEITHLALNKINLEICAELLAI